MTDARGRAAHMCLCALAILWPLVHRGLVAQYHLNPWKLGGFAMYTSARPPIIVSVIDGSGAQRREAELSPAARNALRSFRLLRHVWGLNPKGIRTRTVDMHIARLREKLDNGSADTIILTVRGKGYMLAEHVEVETP